MRYFRLNQLICIALALAFTGCAGNGLSEKTPWPTDGWEIREQDGIGDDLLEEIQRSSLQVDGLLVVHRGKIVLEEYYSGYTANTLHKTYSITKSVLSALVGIALEQGCISSLDDPVLGYFPDRQFLNLNIEKESITIEHLLTMSSGLYFDFDQMLAQMDWIQYVLDQPLAHPPGESWYYSDGGPQVLSAILTRACGMDTRDLAEEYLFRPLGITAYNWQRGAGGYYNGSWGLDLSPRDIAKIGYLYLKDGVWEQARIFPEDWFALSSQSYFQVPDPLEPWELSYGYLWWVHEDGALAAHGLKGQFLYLYPEKDLIVVITGDIPESAFAQPQIWIREYILPTLCD